MKQIFTGKKKKKKPSNAQLQKLLIQYWYVRASIVYVTMLRINHKSSEAYKFIAPMSGVSWGLLAALLILAVLAHMSEG